MNTDSNTGIITGINGSLIDASFRNPVGQNEVGYALLGETQLKSEVIRIRGTSAQLQCFESTEGLKVGDSLLFSRQLLTARLGPGLLGHIFDGLQNPLLRISQEHGFFLPRGIHLEALDDNSWKFRPAVRPGAIVRAGDTLGTVPEGVITNLIMVPFDLCGEWTVSEIAEEGMYASAESLGRLLDEEGNQIPFYLGFDWPVKTPIKAYKRKRLPAQPLVTGIRIVDSFFPVARGGVYCIPGPFGAGKTVLQQITSRNADVDVVVIAACGERAGEVVETLREFPKLQDPRTGKSLMNRTVIVCNTSSMPVAAREASIYTAVTIAEYYRQMGLHVLLLADSTTRWAMALREVSGRLEEIPGEEAFPAYLESRIASFYDRGGEVELQSGEVGSVTIGGTVSPAGGNFEEPVTQGTLKVVGAFHGLSRERAYARRYPAINPLESWSRYPGITDAQTMHFIIEILRKGEDVHQMMTVIGEEGTSPEDFTVFLKSELVDTAYLQQNSFHSVDACCSRERQVHVLQFLTEVLRTPFSFESKTGARTFFNLLTQKFLDWNYSEFKSDLFSILEVELRSLVKGQTPP